MNPVEIEEAVSNLAASPFDAEAFPYAFLEAFGNKDTTIKRLKSGETNHSDLGGVLQSGNIHIKVCSEGEVGATLRELRVSRATTLKKAKFLLATDGKFFEGENLVDGETVACDYEKFSDSFGFFLALAGITTVKEIRENAFDIKATGRLNRLYIELLKENPKWDTADHREVLNHFMARLIFCFFAEDTGIFHPKGIFTGTVERMSARDSSNTHEVLAELFRAMNTKIEEREAEKIKSWADGFPYVNGGLFSGSTEVPRFNRIARSYLLHVGSLDWTKINPDIFGSMIQAVADDEERGALGMHYTSYPNILKVLNPLFLDDLRKKLAEPENTPRKLLYLRQRIARIRVFDPACGSGNFLVIAYKEMRSIEAEINRRRGEHDRRSDIPLTNFRGIEIRHFSCEIARLALIIAEYQCDVLYRSQKLALAEFLPLDAANWITCGNALQRDWLQICPPTEKEASKQTSLFEMPPEQVAIEFENEGGETYICGNPPYLGNKLQSEEQKQDLAAVFEGRVPGWRSLDYVAGWLMKAAEYGTRTNAAAAFVTTNSICQGQQVPILWPPIFKTGHEIEFAYTSFKWANLASHNAGVIVIIVCISNQRGRPKRLYSMDSEGAVLEKVCANINPYLVNGQNLIVESRRDAPEDRSPMLFGNMPRDGGSLLVTPEQKDQEGVDDPVFSSFLRQFVGSEDFINGKTRYCLWIDSGEYERAKKSPNVTRRLKEVTAMRMASKAASTRDFAKVPYRFVQIQGTAKHLSLVIPRHSSARRTFLPVGLLNPKAIVADSAFAIYDPELWTFAVLVSRLHLIWIATVCGQLKTDYRYSNTLGWNTFPLPTFTEQNIRDLSESAERVLIARERYFPSSVGDMYDPDRMQSEFPLLFEAHEHNDEVLERIYIGRKFKNETERLETLFEKFVSANQAAPPLQTQRNASVRPL
jgi:hypothetical protein